MKNKSRKETILIISLIILICLVIGIVIIKVSYNPKEQANGDLSFDEYLEQIINEINEVNKVYDYIDIDSGSKYELAEDFICYEYKGENQDEYIKKIEELYIKPFHEYSNFNIVTRHSEDGEDKKELYVCKRKDCEILEIVDYEVAYEENDRKLIKFTQENSVTTINIYKVDDQWKFKFPVVICK